jgi:hypothetical protein
VVEAEVNLPSQRSSLSQTPEEEDNEGDEEDDEDEDSHPKHTSHKSSRRQRLADKPSLTAENPVSATVVKISSLKDHPGGGDQENGRKVHHFRHFDHSKSAEEPGSIGFSPPARNAIAHMVTSAEATIPRGASFFSHRPRSASIGNRLSETEANEDQGLDEDDEDCHHSRHHAHYHHHYRHRRHHTLDSHSSHQHASASSPFDIDCDPEDQLTSFVPTAASSRSISSKSEKSSSRSSHSPSVENIRHGKYHPTICLITYY